MVNVEAFQGMITCQLLQIKHWQPPQIFCSAVIYWHASLDGYLGITEREVNFFYFFLMLQECCRPTQHPTTDSNVHKSFTALHSKMSGKVSRVPEAAKELLKNRAFYSSRLWRNWDAIEGYMFGEKMIPKNDSNLYTQAWIQGALL